MASVQEPVTTWSGVNGEFTNGSANTIADPSGVLLADPSGVLLADTGETFTTEPATVWGNGTETYSKPNWVHPNIEGEFTVVGNLLFVTNDGKNIITNDGKNLVTTTQQFVPVAATVWSQNDSI
jgi:hypothetical protein